jgi:hypothetical protein
VVETNAVDRVTEICNKLNLGTKHPGPDSFIPPYEYEFYAQKIPEDQREAYIKKCKDWIEAHPPKVFNKPEPVVYDYDSLSKFWSLKRSLPTIDERLSAMEKAGVPLALVEKHRAWDAMMEETTEKRQKAIEDVFGKYASTKPDAKPKVVKTKILKPVKKKMLE